MGRVIVSCTTTSERLTGLYYMLESLRWQTLRPDAVLLNISSDPWLRDQGIASVPEWVGRFDVSVQWVENVGPYRKLLPALECAEADDLVITVDDDVIVGTDWLQSLVMHARKHEDAIICARGREMVKGMIGGWRNYAEWGLAEEFRRSTEIVPMGGTGTVYRRRLLDYGFLTDRAFLSLAPTSDDLWFKMASYSRSVPVVVDPAIDDRSLYMGRGFGLKSVNLARRDGRRAGVVEKIRRNTLGALKGKLGINESENDRAWDRIRAYQRSRKVRTGEGEWGAG